jgi:hypothetical protein
MRFALVAVCASTALAASTPLARAAATDDVEGLIERFRDVGAEGMGFSTSVSGWEFLPYPGSGEAGVMSLGRALPEPSPILRKVIEKGVAAVPALLAHIDDPRPTKLPLVRRMMWMTFADEYDSNPRLSRPPTGVGRRGTDDGLGAASTRRPAPEEHVVTVGDLCFVALGQIVNRNFEAVRYQPTGGMVINSPSSSKALAAAVRAEWSGLTPASHRERLVQDAFQPDSVYRRIGAYYRLSFYYPDATEEVVLKALAQPVFDVFSAEKFVTSVLYKLSSAEKRRSSFNEYVRTHEAGADGVLNRLFDDLDSQEACEQGRMFPKDACRKGDPRGLLIELFARGRDVKSTDRPFLSSSPWGDRYLFIKALRHDTSHRVDEAVRGILVKTTDDDILAIACMRRLIGRGFDEDIRRYATRRATRSPQHGDELRAILESLHQVPPKP